MCSILTTIFYDVDISRTRVTNKYHVADAVGDSIIGLCGDIIQELLYLFIVDFSGGGLLLSKVTECD